MRKKIEAEKAEAGGGTCVEMQGTGVGFLEASAAAGTLVNGQTRWWNSLDHVTCSLPSPGKADIYKANSGVATLSFSLLSPHSRPKKQRSVKCFLTCLPAHAKIRAYRGADRTAGSSRNGGMRRRRRMRSPEGLFPPGRNQDGEIESFVARPRQRAPVAAGVFLQGRVNFDVARVSTIDNVAWSQPGGSSDPFNLFAEESSGCSKREMDIKSPCRQPSTRPVCHRSCSPM